MVYEDPGCFLHLFRFSFAAAVSVSFCNCCDYFFRFLCKF